MLSMRRISQSNCRNCIIAINSNANQKCSFLTSSGSSTFWSTPLFVVDQRRVETGVTSRTQRRSLSSTSIVTPCFLPRNWEKTAGNRWIHSSRPLSSNSPSIGEDGTVLPKLMDFPNLVWPRFINSIRNWIFIHFVIRPYFDPTFNMKEFDIGARQALAIVSDKLSKGQFDELDGLVTPDAMTEIKKNIAKFTLFQRQLLQVVVEDIVFSFPYQIGIIIPDEKERAEIPEPGSTETKPPQKRHVEITVVFHCFRGYQDKISKGSPPLQGSSIYEFSQSEEAKLNVMICNYRFFRDFTKNATNDAWIVNLVNHFLPSDLVPKPPGSKAQ